MRYYSPQRVSLTFYNNSFEQQVVYLPYGRSDRAIQPNELNTHPLACGQPFSVLPLHTHINHSLVVILCIGFRVCIEEIVCIIRFCDQTRQKCSTHFFAIRMVKIFASVCNLRRMQAIIHHHIRLVNQSIFVQENPEPHLGILVKPQFGIKSAALIKDVSRNQQRTAHIKICYC